MPNRRFMIRCTCAWLALGFLVLDLAHAASYPIEVSDGSGKSLSISERPTRVVSLVPSATDFVCARVRECCCRVHPSRHSPSRGRGEDSSRGFLLPVSPANRGDKAGYADCGAPSCPYQNELIGAAGGIPPMLGKAGAVVPVSLEEWKRFNPQVTYGCGGDREAAELLFARPGWGEVDAVKNGQVRYFPCDLTCRAATHTGSFVSWLASVIYCEEFAVPQNLVRSQKVLYSRSIEVDLPYVRGGRILYSTLNDFTNKTFRSRLRMHRRARKIATGSREYPSRPSL